MRERLSLADVAIWATLYALLAPESTASSGEGEREGERERGRGEGRETEGGREGGRRGERECVCILVSHS